MKKFFLMLVAALPLVFTSCGDDDDDVVVPTINLSLTEVTMDYGDTYNDMKCYNAAGKELKNVTWTVDNEFVATVDSKTGKLTAKHVGETKVKAIYENATATAKVVVKATEDDYKVPYLVWNSTMDQVKAEMNKWRGMEPTKNFDVENQLSYSTVENGVGTFPLYGYVFLNNGLSAATITEDASEVNDDDLTDFLKERYQVIESADDGDMVVMYNAMDKNDATLKVTFDYMYVDGDLMPLVTWLPYNMTKSAGDDVVKAAVKELVRAQKAAMK